MNKLKIFVVDSDCDDQPQHVCDIVVAKSGPEAELMVLKARPYVVPSTVCARTVKAELADLERSLAKMKKLTVSKVQKDWESMLNDEGEIA